MNQAIKCLRHQQICEAWAFVAGGGMSIQQALPSFKFSASCSARAVVVHFTCQISESIWPKHLAPCANTEAAAFIQARLIEVNHLSFSSTGAPTGNHHGILWYGVFSVAGDPMLKGTICVTGNKLDAGVSQSSSC